MGLSGGSSNQSSSGASYGYNQSLAQSLSQSMQGIWGPQADALSSMYQGASGLLNRQQGTVQGAAQDLSNRAMPAAWGALGQAQEFMNPNSMLAKQQTANLAQTVGQEFNRNVLPGIQSSAGLGGNIGGSRQALAQGVAAGDAARAISEGATNFYSNAYNTAANMVGQVPSMAASVMNLGMAPYQAAWAPYSSLAGILGSPTVLTQSASGSAAGSQAENWANQQSQGRSNQWGFKLW